MFQVYKLNRFSKGPLFSTHLLLGLLFPPPRPTLRSRMGPRARSMRRCWKRPLPNSPARMTLGGCYAGRGLGVVSGLDKGVGSGLEKKTM